MVSTAPHFDMWHNLKEVTSASISLETLETLEISRVCRGMWIARVPEGLGVFLDADVFSCLFCLAKCVSKGDTRESSI